MLHRAQFLAQNASQISSNGRDAKDEIMTGSTILPNQPCGCAWNTRRENDKAVLAPIATHAPVTTFGRAFGELILSMVTPHNAPISSSRHADLRAERARNGFVYVGAAAYAMRLYDPGRRVLTLTKLWSTYIANYTTHQKKIIK